jgi:hypothetical protein
MSFWAILGSACVGGAVTGSASFVTVRWQLRRTARNTNAAARAQVYGDVISGALAVATRADALHQAMRTRSGLKEGFDVTLGLRRPSDPLELHDWLAQDFGPLSRAWAQVELIDSPRVQQTASELVDALAELIKAATEMGTGRSMISEAIRGMAWTKEQEQELTKARDTAMAKRRAFIAAARADLQALEASALADSLARIGAHEPVEASRLGGGEAPHAAAPKTPRQLTEGQTPASRPSEHQG